MRTLKKLTITLALLIMAVSGAWAQEETLLTTITPTAKEQASYSTANVATVSFSYTADGSSAYLANWGWWGYGWTATVTAAEGYTITKCIFYDDADRKATDSEAPFVVETTDGDKTPRINGTPIDGGNMWSKGIKKIEVYGYKSAPAEPTEWSLTPDETGKTWTLAKMPASNIELQVEYFAESNLFLSKNALADKTNIAVTAGDLGVQFGNDGKSANTITEGTPMTVTYNGTKKVIGFKVEKAAPATLIVNPVVGQIIGSDGKNYDANATLPDGVDKVAMIAYVSGSNGLALALTDIPYFYTWDKSGSYNEKKTAPEICSALNTSKAVTGGTWKLASQDEWKQMFSANGGNEESYTGLNTAIGNAGGTALQENEQYWSSSEINEYDAWLVNLADGNASWDTEGKHYGRMVRACLAF